MRVGAHSPLAGWRKCLQFREEATSNVEQRLRLIAAHPPIEQFKMLWISAGIGDRDLVRSPKALNLQAIYFLGAGPALGAAEHNHRPSGALGRLPSVAPCFLDRTNALNCLLQDVGHPPVHQLGLVTFDEQGFVAIPGKELTDLFVVHPAEYGRVGNLVAVKMKDRENRAVMDGAQELVGMP